MNYVQDLPISVFETLIRSLAHGKLEIHREFPKTESLKDCKLHQICCASYQICGVSYQICGVSHQI